MLRSAATPNRGKNHPHAAPANTNLYRRPCRHRYRSALMRRSSATENSNRRSLVLGLGAGLGGMVK